MLPAMFTASLRSGGALLLLLAATACDSAGSAGSDETSAGGGRGGESPAPEPSDTTGSSTGPGSSATGGAGPVPSVDNGGNAGVAPAGPMGGASGGGTHAGGMPVPAGGGAGAATGGQGGGASGSAGEAGSASGAGGVGVDPCAIPDEYVPPALLSETGLYSDTAAGTLSEGVRPYAPRFELWSDGAEKARWVYLPSCGPIDTSDPDYWNYPVGFKLWKQFDRANADGELVRVETRMIHKYSATKWFMTAYVWNDAQSDAAITELDGPTAFLAAENAKGTEHDVPGQKSCEGCHLQMLDKVLGFSALQLDVEDAPEGFVTLETLEAEGALSDPIARPLTVPGTPEQAAALGYIHANCGHCHNPYSKQAGLNMQLWLTLGTLGTLESTDIYVSTVDVMNQAPQQPEQQPPVRVVPGSLEESAMHWRMIQPPVYPASPEGGDHMPLIGTEITDETGLELVSDWILSLDGAP